MMAVLQATDVRKSFGGVAALRGVSLCLRGGEVHALVGENGAGKSTLLKVLTGALAQDAGTVHLRGRLLAHNTPAKARAAGIAVVYQQPALFPELTVAENIALANDGVSWLRRVRWPERRQRARQLLARVGAERIHPDRVAGRLSMPEQQLVEIAKAVESNPAVLILDEPTASLGSADTERLFTLIAELRSIGTAIVYVSHRFEELFRIADRVTILRDGSSIEERAMADVTTDGLIHLMIGRQLTAVYPKKIPAPLHPPATPPKKSSAQCRADFSRGVLWARASARLLRPSPHYPQTEDATGLQITALSSKSAGVHNITLHLRPGEILGLGGLVGSGRTQLAEALFGLQPIDSGHVSIDGHPITIRSPQDAMREGIAYLPEDRRRHGVVLNMTVAANTTLASLPAISSYGLLRFIEEQHQAEQYVAQLAVKTPSVETSVRDLSGGNQQKVALARWLMTKPRVMILDEPTQGIDVGAKAEIYELIRRMAESGTAILMISSDMAELLAISNRIAVMRKGSIVGTMPRAEATPFGIMHLALGTALESPQ